MPTVEEAIEKVKQARNQQVAVAVWCEDDILERAGERKIKITRKQAAEILDEMDAKQDCELGITWTTIDCYLDELGTSSPIGKLLSEK